MSTHSPSSPKDPALVLAPDLPLSLQPNLDPRTSTSSPTDMHSDSKYNHQNISRESSENAASSSPEVRNTHAPSTDASKYIGTLGRPVEQIPIVAPERSSDNQSASTRPTQSPAPSLYAQPANKAPQDDTEIQRHILAILQKMCDKMEEYEAEDNGRPTSTVAGTGAQPHKASFKKTLLGVPKRFDQGQQQFNPVIEDYEQIFPEDPYGEEAGPNARVFKVYNEEAAAYDADMIGQSSDSSDVLLVFAGLFSAVLTTFVTQTSQALDTDNSAISNSLLSEVVHLLRAQENGTSFGEVAPAITGTTPTANDLWVNGLWFTSLTLSLATALFAVLTKQWLRQYMVKTSGTIRDRSLIRQFRFAGMRKWHVVAIIGILPILLHLALGVFLVGLVIFLVPRSLPMACVVSVITVIIYSLYFISNLVPVFDIQCPYRTPLSDILNILLVDAQNLFAIVLKFICIPFMPNERDFYRRTYHFKPLGVQEHDQVQGQWGSLSLDIIKWLLDTSSNPSVHTVATEAIGGLPPSQREKVNFLHQHFTRDLIEKCLILSGRYPACRPGCVGKLERLARSFPLSQRKRNNDVPRWNVYAAFHDLEDIRGMVSAVGLGFNKEDCANTFNHLLDLPDVRLSPCAWVNLFRNSYGPRMTRCRLEICKRVLEHWDPIPQPHSWKEQTAPVPMSYVLTRGFLEAGILAFGDCDPFKNLDTSESLPLLRNSLSRPPDSPGLRALLTMHHFLDSQNAYESSIDVLSLLHLLWQHIRNELHRHPTALDYVAVFHTTSRSLLESPMLKGNGWMDSVATSRYCATLLDLCSHALFNGPSAAPEFEWNCSERVVELTFPGPTAALKYHAASTSHEAVYLWGCALVRDVKGAFTDFVKFDVLGRQAAFLHISESLLQNFISGLLRQLEHPSPHPEWVLYSVAYLHEPHNLLKTCKILAGHPELASEQTFFDLARVDPDNIAWEGCREHLKTWRPDDTDLVAKFEDSLKALDRFFETRRRRLDPATLFRSIFGRHGNASVVSPSTDVEMGLTVAAPQISPNELSASQERTNAVVAGELIIEQDRETSREGDLAVGSKPLNETDDSLRRTSSRRSELADLASLYLDESYVEGDHFRPSDAAYHPQA